ncbi:hypothetical protein FHS85_002878 [Rhodoligotrophos appendicifer]|nr:hypothetical protein [Rhodoligotrophos appendicifer]
MTVTRTVSVTTALLVTAALVAIGSAHAAAPMAVDIARSSFGL